MGPFFLWQPPLLREGGEIRPCPNRFLISTPLLREGGVSLAHRFRSRKRHPAARRWSFFPNPSLRAPILIPTDRTTVAGADQVNTAIGVQIGSDATVHCQLLLNSLVKPLAGRGIFGSVKDVHASAGAIIVVGDDIIATV